MQKQTINAPGAEALARPTSRRGFLKALAVAGAGAAAGSAVFSREAAAQGPVREGGSDIDVLNFALTIEYFESEVFYPAALEAGILSGRAEDLVARLREIEVQHRDALISAIEDLGGTPVERPQFVVPERVLASQRAFLEAALAQERTDVGASLGLAPLIRSPEVLAAAGAISGVEGENVVAVSSVLGVRPPANTAFPRALTQDQVLARLAPYLGMGEMIATGGDSQGGTARAF